MDQVGVAVLIHMRVPEVSRREGSRGTGQRAREGDNATVVTLLLVLYSTGHSVHRLQAGGKDKAKNDRLLGRTRLTFAKPASSTCEWLHLRQSLSECAARILVDTD